MTLAEKLKNLSKDIQEIAFLVEKLQNNSRLREIEIDLLKEKLQDAYSSVLHLEIVQTAENKNGKKPAAIAEEKPEPESGLQEEHSIPENRSEEGETKQEETTEIMEEAPVISSEAEGGEKAKSINPREEMKEKEPATELHKEQISPEKNGSAVIGDLFRDKQKFRNESLRNPEELNDISSRMQQTAISDISSAIGINERFMFIRELFNGDQTTYSKTIDRLNTVASEEEARHILSDELGGKLDKGPANELLDLVRRKLKNGGNG